MMSRSAVIAILVALEIGVAGEIVAALRGSQAMPYASVGTAADGLGRNLREDGPQRRFPAGERPALYVDIGYADLTIRPGSGSAFAVSIASSTTHAFMRSKAPIAASADGEVLRVASTRSESWTSGDDRMVTVLVPPRTRIVVRNAGNIDLRGTRGDASLHGLAHGKVTVADYDAGDLHVAATDGDVTLERIGATHLNVTTGDGRIRGSAVRVRDGKVESENGAVALAFAPGANTSVTAESDDGAVRFGGAVARVGETGGPASLRLGAGDGHLDVRASDDVDLVR